MNIIKRSLQIELYNRLKIQKAIEAVFKSISTTINKTDLEILLVEIEKEIEVIYCKEERINVEQIQDIVEAKLMQKGYYKEAKSYVLYRERHTEARLSREKIVAFFDDQLIDGVLTKLQKKYTTPEYDFNFLYKKMYAFGMEKSNDDKQLSLLIKAAVELTSQEAPKWEFIAAGIKMYSFSKELKVQEAKRGIYNFYDKLVYLTNEGLYGSYILETYSKEDILKLSEVIDETRNDLLTYSSLDLLSKRYVLHTNDLIPLESIQEMFMGIALHLALKEKDKILWATNFYNMLSTFKVTMATPTMSNARKPFHQLSSCFIDTVPDSLDGIYRSIDNFAKVSKHGGGMGLYFGKVRAQGSAIRGFKGAAGGIIRWIKLVNDTAVAVDQLGVRQGAVAVYLDAWHRDLPEFLQVRTNNGDDRMKAHDIFPAVCYPDLFWKMVKEDLNGTWYLMCPHDIKTIKGYCLEDYYGEEWESKYLDCVNDNRINKRGIVLKELIRLILKSAVETGTPFVFNRDHVNNMNPNSHQGMIYCSNLCTEIAQNMEEIKLISEEITTKDGDLVVVETTKPGRFVVCNLASLVLGNLDVLNNEEMESTITHVIRALDNVIDLNFYPLPYAKITNQQYRSIGLGVSGYHHMLAKNNIAWESNQHLEFADQIFEKINYYAISASNKLAKERGAYQVFKDSDWDNGKYFEKRNYVSKDWLKLKEEVNSIGIRNAYIMAVAPTSSTSVLAGTTAGLDPVMNKFFLEEKRGSIVPRVAPDLSLSTYWLYKNAHLVDQSWTIKGAGVRQRHIDQSQSVNLYITNEFTMKQILNLYIEAWENGVKTIYYIRSKALEVEECESCSA